MKTIPIGPVILVLKEVMKAVLDILWDKKEKERHKKA